MISRWIKNWRHEQGRKLLGLLLLCSLCVSVIPVPVALPVTKDTSEPFPCQDRPCGCRTADQCRKQCCCFTKEQKIAWAKKRGVPTNCVVNESSSQLATDRPEQNLADSSCHSKSSVSLREQLVSASTKKRASSGCETSSSCCKSGNRCEREAASAKSVRSVVEKPTETKARKFVIGLAAEKCRGGATDWNSLPWSVPPALFVSWKPVIAVSPVSPVRIEIWTAICERPPVPPPRDYSC